MVAAMTRLALALVLFATPALAGTSTWEIDTAHTSAQFAVKHLMVSTVRGTMGPVTGTVTIDDADLTSRPPAPPSTPRASTPATRSATSTCGRPTSSTSPSTRR
jgi:hypothetical protein